MLPPLLSITNHPRLRLACTICILFCAICNQSIGKKTDWEPISPELLQLQESQNSPDTAAEFIFQYVTMYETVYDSTYEVYKRAKIFDSKAIDYFKKVEITYFDSTNIDNIKARTIKSDGTIIELERSDIFETRSIKHRYFSTWVKTFALPNLEVGDIVEYQYQKTTRNLPSKIHYIQDQYPIQHYRLRVGATMMEFLSYNMPPHSPEKGEKFYTLNSYNIPAKRGEPFTAPRIYTEQCFISQFPTYYSYSNDPVKFFKKWERELFADSKHKFIQTQLLKEKALELTQEATSNLEKLQRIYEFCQNEITNPYSSESGLTLREAQKLSDNKNAKQTLSRGYGSRRDKETLFGSLAKSAGIETQYARCYNQSQLMYDESYLTHYMFPDSLVASQLEDGTWLFLDPGDPHMPFASLDWENAWGKAIIGSKQFIAPLDTQANKPREHGIQRTGDLTLSSDGELSGTIRLQYEGLKGVAIKRALSTESEQARIDFVEEDIKHLIPNAKVSELSIEHANDAKGPFTVNCIIHAPLFADKLENRLFIQPAIFHKNRDPVFVAKERINIIDFKYPSFEKDEIVIQLPEGFTIEEGSVPTPLDLKELGTYDVRIFLNKGGSTLNYHRKLEIKTYLFPQKIYSSVKSIFDKIHDEDRHVLTLKKN